LYLQYNKLHEANYEKDFHTILIQLAPVITQKYTDKSKKVCLSQHMRILWKKRHLGVVCKHFEEFFASFNWWKCWFKQYCISPFWRLEVTKLILFRLFKHTHTYPLSLSQSHTYTFFFYFLWGFNGWVNLVLRSWEGNGCVWVCACACVCVLDKKNIEESENDSKKAEAERQRKS